MRSETKPDRAKPAQSVNTQSGGGVFKITWLISARRVTLSRSLGAEPLNF
jgi:hypothetical protein